MCITEYAKDCALCAEHEIRLKKYSRHMSAGKFVLTLIKIDLTLVAVYAVTLDFGLDACMIKIQIENVLFYTLYQTLLKHKMDWKTDQVKFFEMHPAYSTIVYKSL